MKKLSILLLIAASCSYAGVVKFTAKTAYHGVIKPVAKATKKTAKFAAKVIY